MIRNQHQNVNNAPIKEGGMKLAGDCFHHKKATILSTDYDKLSVIAQLNYS
jgi:hypothetical protein